MPRPLTRDTRTSLARALRHACRLTHRCVSGEHLMTILVSALHPGQDPRPARAVLHEHGAAFGNLLRDDGRKLMVDPHVGVPRVPPGPIEEGAKLLVPLLLLAFGSARFKDPLAGLYLVLVSGATMAIIVIVTISALLRPYRSA